MLNTTLNLHIKAQKPLISPEKLINSLALSQTAIETVVNARETISNILQARDNRLLVIVGPCSIHDTGAALEYAEKLKTLASSLEDELFIVMRTYFEKPRTTIGWKGLINDPHIDGSFNIEEGLKISRQFLIDLNNMGVAAATEALDPILPQYLQDLICWSAIGARTTESQVHRAMASGLSMPVGFKNTTSGDVLVAVNALKSANSPHSFLGIDTAGKVSVVHTTGNDDTHVILRGGGGTSNYSESDIGQCETMLSEHALAPNIMVDCSHANSNKDHNNQPKVLAEVERCQKIIKSNGIAPGAMSTDIDYIKMLKEKKYQFLFSVLYHLHY